MRQTSLLALVACCGGGDPKRTDVASVCNYAGELVVTEGLLEADRAMRCVDRACDFQLRDQDHIAIVRVMIPDGFDGLTAAHFPRAEGRRISFGQHTVVTGRVVTEPPPCRIDLVHISQP